MFYRKFALEFRTMGGNKILMACIPEMTFHLHIEVLHAPETDHISRKDQNSNWKI